MSRLDLARRAAPPWRATAIRLLRLTLLALLPTTASAVTDQPTPRAVPTPTSATTVVRGGSLSHAKSDSAVLMGAPGSLDGMFQDDLGQPAWQGWTPVDNTATPAHWNVSDFNCANLEPGVPDNLAWWCGDYFPDPCGPGYGHDWVAKLAWSGSHAGLANGLLVRVTAVANVSILDLGSDRLELQVLTGDGLWTRKAWIDGTQDSLVVDVQFALGPEDLWGPDQDEVRLRWDFISDGLWDDEDCQLDSSGPVVLDRIEVWFYPNDLATWVQIGETADCQPGTPQQWFPEPNPGDAGNFGHVWPQLDALDPCAINTSPQVAFIDDGVVVPGTGGSPCQTWCYGPGGWVVRASDGGLGFEPALDAMVLSPALDWPDTSWDGGLLEFDVYPHLPFEPNGPFIFWNWRVRTAAAGQDITERPWMDDNLIYIGGPEYQRFSADLTDLVTPGCERIQVGLGVMDLNHVWGAISTDATPAPYFDNVRITAFRHEAPRLSVLVRDMAQDDFPQAGVVDLGDLGANSVRFDAAVNAAASWDTHIDPGDSLTVRAVALRDAPLDGPPVLHYRLIPNPLFDPYRTAVPSGAGNTATAGAVACQETPPPAGDGETFFVDLPDTGFFFPGDVIHYYFRAVDTQARVALAPPDTAGFGAIPAGFAGLDDFYDPHFTVRALPTILDGAGDQPGILVWDDSGSTEELDAWLGDLSALVFEPGEDYDLFRTRVPWEVQGNGLAGRTGLDVLRRYDTILYSSGEQTFSSLADDEHLDAGDDNALLLEDWLHEPDRTLLMMGDDLASSLAGASHPSAGFFLQGVMGVSLQGADVRPAIDGQTMPTVWGAPGDPVFADVGWPLDGGCPRQNTFDDLAPTGDGVLAAEFLAPGGAPGAYPSAAAVATPFYDTGSGSETITTPYGLAAIGPSAGLPQASAGDKAYFPPGPLSFLNAVLNRAGHPVSASGPPPLALSLAASPNPFNPRTEIRYTVDAAGPVSLALYDLRGRRVRRLVDEAKTAGAWVTVWDGRDDRGRGVSSGVYFCILEAATGTRSLKVTLLR